MSLSSQAQTPRAREIHRNFTPGGAERPNEVLEITGSAIPENRG